MLILSFSQGCFSPPICVYGVPYDSQQIILYEEPAVYYYPAYEPVYYGYSSWGYGGGYVTSGSYYGGRASYSPNYRIGNVHNGGPICHGGGRGNGRR